jgi:queuosine precursor transporter
MTNELLWMAFVLIDLTMVLVVFRHFGGVGLYGLIVFNLILCNIQVLKTVELFGLTTTLGNILYASVFLSTDLLSEYYGKERARKAVFLGFVALFLATVYMQIALRFIPAASDFADPHLQAIFGFLPRVAVASMVAYLISQLHDVWAFHILKQRTQGRHLWLRNNLSTMASQLLDSVIFCAIAFIGVFPWNVWWEILLTTYLVKMLVAMLDTPFIYLAKRFIPQSSQTFEGRVRHSS